MESLQTFVIGLGGLAALLFLIFFSSIAVIGFAGAILLWSRSGS
jgi:hypothetical protein